MFVSDLLIVRTDFTDVTLVSENKDLLASQDTLEVMLETDWLTDWVVVSLLDWCDPGEWGYLLKTWLIN